MNNDKQCNFTNLHAETGTLCALFKYGKLFYYEVDRIVTEECFNLDIHKIIWRSVKELLKNDDSEIDLFTVEATIDKLGLNNFLAKDNNYDYFQALSKEKIEKANGVQFAKQIRKLNIAKQKHDKLVEAQDKYKKVDGTESIQEILSIAENAAFDNEIVEEDIKPKLMGDGLGMYIKELMDAELPQLGLSTGFPLYDAAIGGARKGNVQCIAARMKIGKSILAKEIGYYVSKNGIPVLNVDTEMSRQQHMLRLTGSISGVKIREIETGKFKYEKDKVDKVRNAVAEINSLPFYHKNVAGFDWDGQISVMKNWLMQIVGLNNDGTASQPCLIILDYLKLMNNEGITKNLREHEMLGYMSIGLHNLSMKYNIPIITFAQLNRDGISKEDTSIVGDSDRIARYVSSLAVFKDKTYDEILADGLTEGGNKKMIVLAARDGPGSEGNYINFILNKDICKISELKTNTQLFYERNKQDTGFKKVNESI